MKKKPAVLKMSMHEFEIALSVLESLLGNLRYELDVLRQALVHQLPGFSPPKLTPPASTGSEEKKS